MNLRKSLSDADLGELKYIIERIVEDWEDRISEEALTRLEGVDHDLSKDDVNLISFQSLGITQKITHVIERMYPEKTIFASGFFLYPPTGYMGWHTNSNEPGKRLYITYTKEGNKSFFRYRNPDNNRIITDYDDKGLTAREFPIYDKPPYMWHCVGSNCDRYSFGFTIR